MFDYQVIYLWKQDKNTKEIKQINKHKHKLTSNITLETKLL